MEFTSSSDPSSILIAAECDAAVLSATVQCTRRVQARQPPTAAPSKPLRLPTNNPFTITLTSNRLIYANYVPGIPYSYLPTFTTPPTGRSLSPGDNTSLNTFATGVGVIGYQWRFNSANLSGATNIILNLTNVTAARAGFYDVLATNAYGSVTSPKAPVALFGLQLVAGVGNTRLPLLVADCAPGAAFSLQMATSLIGSNWTEITPWTLNAARGYFIDAAVTNKPQRYYRLVPQ